MMFTLPQLPYDADELEPYMSLEQVMVHYDKLHDNYVKKLNKLAKGDNEDLEKIIKGATPKGEVYNTAAQHYNHCLYWKSMNPTKVPMSLKFEYAMEKAFGTIQIFKDLFVAKAKANFGSGWIWLVKSPLSITVTHDAEVPLVNKPLLCMDLWEHAYFLDYKSEKDRYYNNFINYLINWKYASEEFEIK